MLLLEAQKYLEVVRTRGKAETELQRGYYNIATNKEFFLAAYANLYANKGALTPGRDPEDTIDGMSLKRIETIMETLKKRESVWKPVRRMYIRKRNGKKKRPLGIPGWNDKLLQEVIRMVLEAYYEPQFRESSHGFRPNRGCHTALHTIKKQWTNVRWFIEGDIKGCFDNLDWKVILGILRRKMKDDTFLHLIKGMLEAGYVEDWKYHQTYSGTPQGGIVSPILANIVLNELDKFVEDVLIPKYSRGKDRADNREYNRIASNAYNAKKKGGFSK